MSDYTKVNLTELDDVAVKHGFADHHQARFASQPLGLHKLGLSHQRYYSGKRTPFGHKHGKQEEVFIFVTGSGRMKLDDDIIKIKAWDAVRVAPGVMSAVEAGPDGLEFLVVGAPKLAERDIDMQTDWWSD